MDEVLKETWAGAPDRRRPGREGPDVSTRGRSLHAGRAAASTFPNPTGLCTPVAVHQRPGYSCGRWKTPWDVRRSVGTRHTSVCGHVE